MTATPESDRHVDAGDLLGGDDHDFVVNLYLAVLGRWPDPGGYRRFRALVAGRPEGRTEALREVAGSAEAGTRGQRVRFGAGSGVPPGPTQTLSAALSLRTEWLHDQVTALRDAIGTLGTAEFTHDLIESRDAALRFEINAVRRELGERIDALAAPVGGDAAVTAVAQLVARHAADLVAAATAAGEQRQRALEARVLALEALLHRQDARLAARPDGRDARSS